MEKEYCQTEQKSSDSNLICAAENLIAYCSSCASGESCCSANPSEEMNQEPCENDPLILKIAETVDTYKKKQKSNKEKNPDEMSSGEIAKRLFGTWLDSPSSEGPLDVIIEINGEEDDFGISKPTENSSSNLGRLHSSFTSSSSISENYVVNSECSYLAKEPLGKTSSVGEPSDALSKTTQSFESPYETIFFKDYKESMNQDGSRYFCNKANQLISEIESCFTETTTLVEKTLQATQSSNAPRVNHKTTLVRQNGVESPDRDNLNNVLNDGQSNSEDTYQKAHQIRQSVEEAINLFDSIINEDSSYKPKSLSHLCPPSDLNESIDADKGISLDYANSDIESLNQTQYPSTYNLNHNGSLGDQINIFPKDYPKVYQRPNNLDFESTKTRPSFRRSLFDAEIDQLFRECYDLAALEPSTTLDSCLKNLESLCFQLKRARDKTLKEMKLGQNSTGLYYDSPDDELYKEALSLLQHDRFSMINEVIERKVNKKRQKKKYSLDPPLMGLEGKTHKKIAEVIPGGIPLENGMMKENVVPIESYDNYSNPFSHEHGLFSGDLGHFTIQNQCNQQEMNSSDYAYDLNSDLSTSTNTFDTSYFDDPHYQRHNDNAINTSDALNSSKEENSSVISQEETLALYADNQELQESLLSILHSLNDIHNNFLQRRRIETEQSQQSSLRIHNKILSILSHGSQIEKKRIAHDYVNIPMDLNSSQRNSYEDDFEAIDKIIKISDELKNLWLSYTPDFPKQRRIPTRTKSFTGRLDRRYRTSKYSRNLNKSYNTNVTSSTEDLLDMNSKCYSMPNLIAIDLDTPTEERLINFPPSSNDHPFSFSNSILKERNPHTPSTEVKNFIRQLKIENEKCYTITLNFLKRIMMAYRDIEESEGIRGSIQQPFSQQACLASY